MTKQRDLIKVSGLAVVHLDGVRRRVQNEWKFIELYPQIQHIMAYIFSGSCIHLFI